MTEQRINSAEQGGKTGDQGVKSDPVGSGVRIDLPLSGDVAERPLQASASVEIGQRHPKIDALEQQIGLRGREFGDFTRSTNLGAPSRLRHNPVASRYGASAAGNANEFSTVLPARLS